MARPSLSFKYLLDDDDDDDKDVYDYDSLASLATLYLDPSQALNIPLMMMIAARPTLYLKIVWVIMRNMMNKIILIHLMF